MALRQDLPGWASLLYLPAHEAVVSARPLGCRPDAVVLDLEDFVPDAYYAPAVSDQSASVYEHCARAIDRSLRVGAHGLPLMGTGDWNDGMNRVGHEGHGESVWVAWFLCRIVSDFSPLARSRGDCQRAERWEAAAAGWTTSLQTQGWDGAWFKRAFFDNGEPLGSLANAECQVDLIAQSWAVLSGVAPPDRQAQAMAAVDARLVDREHGLLRLLDPPLDRQTPSAGYIQAYPPGVRENGGQYSHAAVWALMAHAQLGHEEAAWHAFTCLSPAHRSRHPSQADVYALEPYVMAGDIYSQAPYEGRGGWSWYTGSAAWMHRAAIESIVGLRVEADGVRIIPCLPPHWPQATVTLRRHGADHIFVICRAGATEAIARARSSGAAEITAGVRVSLPEDGRASHHLLLLAGPARSSLKTGSDVSRSDA